MSTQRIIYLALFLAVVWFAWSRFFADRVTSG